MPAGTEEALKCAAATGQWSIIILSVIIISAVAAGLYLTRQWVKDSGSKSDANAKIAADSIAASAKREDLMVARQNGLEKYVRDTLVGLVERTVEALKEASEANRQLIEVVRDATDSNKEMKSAMRELIRATYGQTGVLKEVAHEISSSDSGIGKRKPQDHGGDIHE